MSERAEVSFDAALMMALRADAQKELDELPSPAQLKERYPDTSRWDARLQAALHKHRPVLKRVLITVLTLVILTLGALAVSADFRRAVYTMIQKFMPVEMQLTYQVDGEPLEQLPNGYSDHYVPDGFERDYEQGYDNEISFLHAYVDVNDKNIFYYVDCSVIQDYGQVETFDNEHTVYERIKIGTADATLGTSNNGGRTGYVLVWEKDGISHIAKTFEQTYFVTDYAGGSGDSGALNELTIAFGETMDEMPDIRITVSENGYIQINGKRAYPLSLKYAGKRLYVHLLGCLQDGADLQQ